VYKKNTYRPSVIGDVVQLVDTSGGGDIIHADFRQLLMFSDGLKFGQQPLELLSSIQFALPIGNLPFLGVESDQFVVCIYPLTITLIRQCTLDNLFKE